ncbi:MAG: hypothetical protein VYD87_01550 [Pseudomonadota bacterium]|nr:hypothetical protein [Pseudomonadota bacterium]MEE3098419.1 hypothetical protein [Pseudomonadota bacterium]
MFDKGDAMDKSDDPDQAWELIPWYVNGSLPEDQAAEIERRRDADPDFAAEVERQLGLAVGICMIEDDDAPRARSWETLRARIEAEERARTPASLSWRDRLAALLGPLGGRTGALAGMACAVALVTVVAMRPADDDGFRTLTGADGAGAAAIKFQAAPGVDRDALAALLADRGLVLLGEPSEAGVFRAAPPEGADLAAEAEALMAAPEILFAAPESRP